MSASTKEEALSGPEPSRLALLWASTVGKKALMALSGLVLFAYVVAHLLGNLRLYGGREAIDAYARFLHESPGLLWTARAILLAAVLVHAVAGFPSSACAAPAPGIDDDARAEGTGRAPPSGGSSRNARSLT